WLVILGVVLAAGLGFYAGAALDTRKLEAQLRNSPWITAHDAVAVSQVYQTNQLRLEGEIFSLPALGEGFENGGGAILELKPDAVLVLAKSGRFLEFTATGGVPSLRPLEPQIELNNEAYAAFAKAEGYAIRPGANVGNSGLGMRAHDLLYLPASNELIASYTFWKPDQNCAVLRAAAMALDARREIIPGAAWRVIFETSPCLGLSGNKAKPFAGHQAGGRLGLLPDGSLLVTVGDFKNDGSHRQDSADDGDGDYGKIWQVNAATGAKQLFTRGHRNPQGLLVTDAGDIWETEHGPVGGDELNTIRQGTHYGWPRVTLGRDCDACGWQTHGRHDGFAEPVYSWVPSIGVSQLIELKNFHPLWDGDFLVASLVAETLHRVRVVHGGVQLVEPVRIGERIRDLYQAADGGIVLWTDSGKLIFLKKSVAASASAALVAALSPAAKDEVALCGACHGLESAQGRAGVISLWGISGRRVAGTDYPAYSDALKGKGGVWSGEALSRFLENPQGFAPGTSMPYEGIADAATRAEVVRFLEQLR
ncbi:MAG: PQQ-dependent sugar dehydrogenase, partial [Aestuariivirgaceae bacterium]|nr:PQQ-dependent sugar dehydrogenase [Aestuariivirgaceae bacterium]